MVNNLTPIVHSVDRRMDYLSLTSQMLSHVEHPRLFGPKSGTDKALHLRKKVYGLYQAPRTTFFEKLKAGVEEREWQQSEVDPCLFMKSGMIRVAYVDDTTFASANIKDLDQEILSLGIRHEK